MSDFIKREDAVEAVYEALRTPLLDYRNDFFHDSMSYAIEIVNNIPSAGPERKKGKWIEDEIGYGFWTCSVCGFVTEAYAANILYHFCPKCGAEMRGGT